MEIKQQFIPSPSKRSSGKQLNKVLYILAHDSGNDGATAQNNVDYYVRTANETEASAHFFVDDKIIINCIPETLKAWHCRYNTAVAPNIAPHLMNDCAIAIELCYGSAWGNLRNLVSYNNYTTLIASLCMKYNLDPETALVGHFQVDPTRRTDPLNAFKTMGKTWTQFKLDVKSKMNPIIQEEMVNIPVKKSQVDKVLAYLKTI